MAFQAYISVKGRKQGQFKGETLQANRRGKWITVLSASMDLQSPIDSATGQPSGKRQWRPVKIVKEWGAASPQGLAACSTNEDLTEVRIEFVKPTATGPEDVHQAITLTEVRIEFVKPTATGPEDVYQAITLTDASLSEVRRFVSGDPAQPTAATPLEEWSFTFRKIEVVDNDGNTFFTDDWGLDSI